MARTRSLPEQKLQKHLRMRAGLKEQGKQSRTSRGRPDVPLKRLKKKKKIIRDGKQRQVLPPHKIQTDGTLLSFPDCRPLAGCSPGDKTPVTNATDSHYKADGKH